MISGRKTQTESRDVCRGSTLLLLVLALLMPGPAGAAEDLIQRSQPGLMTVKEGSVNFQPRSNEEVPANQPQPLGFGDSLRTLRFSGATVQFNDRSILRMTALTKLSIVARGPQTNLPAVRLFPGEIYVS